MRLGGRNNGACTTEVLQVSAGREELLLVRKLTEMRALDHQPFDSALILGRIIIDADAGLPSRRLVLSESATGDLSDTRSDPL